MRNWLQSMRILLRFKTYTFINLTGLVFSIACALIIARYIHQENTVDHFCPELERTFLTTIVNDENKVEMSGSRNLNKDDLNYKDPLDDPRVEKFSRFILSDDNINVNDHWFSVSFIATDSVFFSMLPYPLVKGSNILHSPSEVIITRSLSERLFGKEEPLGQNIKYSNGEVLTVTGVIDTPVTKASIQFDLVLSLKLQNSWNRVEYELVQLYRKEDVTGLNQQNATPMKLMASMQRPVYYQLTPLRDFYFNKQVDSKWDVHILRGNSKSIAILIVVSALLLLVGIFNYINLYTVVMLKRAHEFGIKKVFGASGSQIFFQIYLENFCLGVIALFFIWLFVEVTRSIVGHWLGIPVMADIRFDLTASGLLLFGMPLLTSLFPFIRYNYAPPTNSIRSIGMGGHSIVSRMVFLLMQYILTICLLITAIYFSRQLYCMLNYDLGYITKDIIQCPIHPQSTSWDVASEEEYKLKTQKINEELAFIKRKMDESPLFSSWIYGEPPIDWSPYTTFTNTANQKSGELIVKSVNQKYMELFGFQLLEGRLWKDSEDQFGEYKLIINETAQKLFGLENIRSGTLQPKQRLWFSSGVNLFESPAYEVVGVIKDFKTGHLARPDCPLAFYYSSNGGEDGIMASIVPGKRKEAITYLEKLFHEANGEGEFNYSFVEDKITDLYKEDNRTAKIYVTFAMIAIFISCLGLFGLSLYDIRQRYREIALRKINGATARDIYKILLFKYLYILTIAFVIGSGLSYIVISKYMEDFSYRAPLSPWIFITAGGVTVIISLCTLWHQIHKAVKIQPAIAMKTE